MIFLLEVLVSLEGEFFVIEGYKHSIRHDAGKTYDEPISFFPGDDLRKSLFLKRFHRLNLFFGYKRNNFFSFFWRYEEGSSHSQSKIAKSYNSEGIRNIVGNILRKMFCIMINFLIIWIYQKNQDVVKNNRTESKARHANPSSKAFSVLKVSVGILHGCYIANTNGKSI